MRKLTLQAIAEAANVSCATVSRCLAGREGVGEKTRARVLQLCREMGYNPNFTDTGCSRSGRIGLLCPSLKNPVCARLAGELESYLAELGYSMVAAQSHGSRQGEQEALQRLRTQRVDGVVIIPAARESRRLLKNQDNAPEGVFLDANLGDQPASYVAVDHFLGGQAAARHLYALGHREILFLGDPGREIHRKRQEGYVSACRQLRLDPALLTAPEGVDWDRYTAVVAADCAAALAVPGDKALVSFDGEALENAGIGLTTFDSPANMARIAADILLEKLDGSFGGYSHRMVVPQLNERNAEVKQNG